MNQTLKVSFAIGRRVKRDGFACLDEGQREKPLGSRMTKINALRELQSASGEELRPFFGRTLTSSPSAASGMPSAEGATAGDRREGVQGRVVMAKMSRLAKLGLVIGGYVAACLIASGVVYVWVLFTQGPIAQASSGMYAFGDLLLFIVIFGVLALIPTGLAVYFLFRKFPKR